MVTHYRNNLDRLIFWDNSTKFKSARKKIMRELTVGDFLKEKFRIDFSLEQSYYDCDFEKKPKIM